MLKIATVAITLALIGAVSSTTVASAQEAGHTNKNDHSPATVTVQGGDTLSGIAEKYDTVSTRLFNANESIADPDLIYVGQEIRIPANDEQLPDRTLPSKAPGQNQVMPKQKPRPADSTPAAQPDAVAPASANASVWDKIAMCESSGNWSINTGNGYYGGLQFSLSSWRLVGGTGLPSEASREEQISRAEALRKIQGWGAWPQCSLKAGMSY